MEPDGEGHLEEPDDEGHLEEPGDEEHLEEHDNEEHLEEHDDEEYKDEHDVEEHPEVYQYYEPLEEPGVIEDWIQPSGLNIANRGTSIELRIDHNDQDDQEEERKSGEEFNADQDNALFQLQLYEDAQLNNQIDPLYDDWLFSKIFRTH